MTAPKTTKTLQKRIDDLEDDIKEIEEGARNLPQSDSADGLHRVLRELRRTLHIAREHGDIAKLDDA
jgi:hypothetical protein